MRTVARAEAGQPIGVDRLLPLCAALRLDPMTLTAPAADMPVHAGPFLWTFFATAVGVWHRTDGLGLRRAGRLAGLSYATIRRARLGSRIAAESVVAICRAMGRHPHDWTATPAQAARWAEAAAEAGRARQGRAQFARETPARVSREAGGVTVIGGTS